MNSNYLCIMNLYVIHIYFCYYHIYICYCNAWALEFEFGGGVCPEKGSH